MFRLLGLRLEGIKWLCVSDQLFTFLDLDKPQLAVNTGGEAKGTQPNSTYIRRFSIDAQGGCQDEIHRVSFGSKK